MAAARALGEFGTQASVKPLLAALGDSDPQVREGAAEVGSVTYGQTTATALGQEAPEIDADKGQDTGQGGHRDDAEDEDLVAWKVERVGQQETTDRSRGAERRDAAVSHEDR